MAALLWNLLALYQTLFGWCLGMVDHSRIASDKHHQLFACTMPSPCLRLSPRMPRAILRIKVSILPGCRLGILMFS
ncbi:hypothetical protein C8R45DRAFT_1000520 [Mycena sanguinolenta]|nr:hypothetical protein C8R45DRAFT_1000520 [Mycena sanguinolenta]